LLDGALESFLRQHLGLYLLTGEHGPRTYG
jgi:hypothetical protein